MAEYQMQHNRSQAHTCSQMQDSEAVVLTIQAFGPGCFGVRSMYHPPLVVLYKQLSHRPVWHPSQKLWAFRDESYAELMQKLLAADFPSRVLRLVN